MRVVFVNLHGNEMLLKTMNKFVFKQSVAIKHKYFLDWLLSQPDIQVCSYINERGFSMASSFGNTIMNILNLFRFAEHRKVLKKNGIDRKKILVLKKPSQIQKEDLVILYRHCASQMLDASEINAFKVMSMIHFWGSEKESRTMREIGVDMMLNESNLIRFSEIFQKYYGWYKGDIIVHPFVFGERFKPIKPFNERKAIAFSTGTITYKETSEFIAVYGNPCDQPSRKQIKDNAEELKDLIACYNSDFAEEAKIVKPHNKSRIARLYQALHYKLFESQQKKYYSFNMVEKFNEYKMCIIGEEILGVPGIGFVEGMASGCAYIGLNTGMYEDYGMKEGVHYIGYDGSLEDLKKKITYYQQPEHQDELERIAKTGCDFVRTNFNGPTAAANLFGRLEKAQQEWLNSHN
jgi:hypothetical protein